MKILWFFLTLATIGFVCSCSEQPQNEPPVMTDRFAAQFKNISIIANVRKLTDLKRDMSPFFSPSGDRIYFSRLAGNSPGDIDNELDKSADNYLSIDYKTNKLFALQEIPPKPKLAIIRPDSLPLMQTENPSFGIGATDAIYFTTTNVSYDYMRNIYKAVGDSIIQLTYGNKTSILQILSPDERYLVFLYDYRYTNIVLYDNQTGNYYMIQKSPEELYFYDLEPGFSPDSKYLVFLRSQKPPKRGVTSSGDIWLVELTNTAE